MAVPIRPARKHRFFIKITISQYHDIDISYIDIDIGKNAFSMTTLLIIHKSKVIVFGMKSVGINPEISVTCELFHVWMKSYIQNR